MATGMKPSFFFLVLLSLGHLVTDVNQGSVPGILPYLKEQYALSYAAVGSLLMVSNITSSVIQPLFGYLSDRSSQRWLLPAGVITAGLGLTLVGWAGSLPLIYLGVAVSGMGVASYHPEGSRVSRYMAGDMWATGMSIYSVGGNLGYALGPVVLAALLSLGMGARAVALLLIPSVLMGLILGLLLPRMGRREVAMAELMVKNHGPEVRPNRWGAELKVLSVVMLRSLFQFGMLTFLQFYWINFRGGTKESAAVLLFVFLGGGAVGTLLAGPLADRLGAKKVLMGSLALIVPLHFVFMVGQGALAYGALLGMGLGTVSTVSLTLVMSQLYLPRNVGMASGLNVGLSIGLGGVGATVLGAVADRVGIPATMWGLVVCPLVALVVTWRLPPAEPAGRPGASAHLP